MRGGDGRRAFVRRAVAGHRGEEGLAIHGQQNGVGRGSDRRGAGNLADERDLAERVASRELGQVFAVARHDQTTADHREVLRARFSLQNDHLTRGGVDYLSDADLNGTTGAKLRKAYQLLIFEGHHEYVTQHEYDAVTNFRDRGGNLIFLSANNFFWKITISNNVMTRVA